MKLKLKVVSTPDNERRQPMHDHLWVLVGGGECSDGGTAFFLGQDRDVEGQDIARDKIAMVIANASAKDMKVDAHEVSLALEDYRQMRYV